MVGLNPIISEKFDRTLLSTLKEMARDTSNSAVLYDFKWGFEARKQAGSSGELKSGLSFALYFALQNYKEENRLEKRPKIQNMPVETSFRNMFVEAADKLCSRGEWMEIIRRNLGFEFDLSLLNESRLREIVAASLRNYAKSSPLHKK